MNTQSNIRITIENERAAFAFEKVKAFVEANKENEKQCKDYRSYIKKMPSMIQVNGLGQTLAFYYSKNEEVYQKIYQDIASWIRNHLSHLEESKGSSKPDEFVKWVVNLESPKYRIVTRETLALLNWMRRFSDGMIKAE